MRGCLLGTHWAGLTMAGEMIDRPDKCHSPSAVAAAREMPVKEAEEMRRGAVAAAAVLDLALHVTMMIVG